MKTFSLLFMVAGLALAVSFAFSPQPEADAWGGKPCARKKFDTVMVKKACAEGGQKEAKKNMKLFVKAAKKKGHDIGCDHCHSKLGGDFPLEKKALSEYRKIGKEIGFK